MKEMPGWGPAKTSWLGFHRWQPLKGRAQFGLHGHRIEVAGNANDQLAANGAIVPGLQIVQGDRAHGGQLGLARIRAVGAVHQLVRFAFGDPGFVIVAPDDPRGFQLLGQLELFGIEFGVQQQVQSQRKHLVRVAFERIPRKRGGVLVALGLDVGSLGLQQIVQGVAVQFGSAAGPPGLAVETHQARLGRVFVARAARNEDRSGDEGEFVILLQKENDAVLQDNSLWLLGLEIMQFGDGYLLPWLVLLRVEGDGRK